MNARVIAGALFSYVYNHGIGRFPSRSLRHGAIKIFFGSFGKGSGVQLDCRFLNPRNVHIGERNVINFGCLLDGRKYGIRTGNDVSIGPEASILTLGHNPQSSDFSDRGGEVVIGDRVWIGYRAVILPGVTIGDGAVVGAGAVVTKNVESFTIVAGNPARKIGDRSRALSYHLNYLPFLV